VSQRVSAASVVLVGLACSVWSAAQAPAPPAVAPLLNQYCVTCHSARLQTAGLSLEGADLAHVADRAEVWEKVVQKLRSGMMPPPGRPRPDAAAYESAASWLEDALDRAEAAHPDPGGPLLHRLNRAEYANAIRDLLALDVDAAALLPPDDSSSGFDNVADALGVSPALMERYLSAADQVSALAVGDPEILPNSLTYHVRADTSQSDHVDGLPLGTRGGLLVRPTLPLDGEYVLKVKLLQTNLGSVRGLEYPQQLEVSVDGVRVHLVPMGGPADFAILPENAEEIAEALDARLVVRLSTTAGPHTVAATFLQKTDAQGGQRLQPFLRSNVDATDHTGLPHIESLTINGPFGATGSSDTPSRRRVFICRPSNGSLSRRSSPESDASEGGCATKIVGTLARRAYRRPVTTADMARLMALYDRGRSDGDFEAGVQFALRGILASAKFVFRGERDASAAAPGTVYRVGDVELASRLSFFLWSTIPDDELLRVAGQGRLKDPAVLDQQVRRMLADPKSRALVDNFAGQWLYLRNLKSTQPDQNEFPDFDDNLRQGFQREAELFFESIMREDRSVLDLLSADYTFVNERLARHYGIPNIYGSRFRRVTIADDARKGLLGKGAILLVTSHAGRTSPVVRGKWILDNLLGAPPPPPPPDVPALEEKDTTTQFRSVRERVERHRASPACSGCHQLMDPLGFALENFDAVGAWRIRDEGAPIDASGRLVDGTKVDGVVTLRQAILKRPELFVSTLTSKLLVYALGRGLSHHDAPVVRGVVRAAAADNYRFSALILGIVRSTPFQMRIKAPTG
jgi:cytochrome c551/c552